MGQAPIQEKEDTFFDCYLCGKPALYVIELAGEDEPLREAAACDQHARGHVHRGLLTPLDASEAASSSR